MRATITAAVVQHVRKLASDGGRTKDIARHMGLSESTVHKIRHGCYDDRLDELRRRGDDDARVVVWCPTCRARVYPPCPLCRLRAFEQRQADCGAASRQRPDGSMSGARPALLPESIADVELKRTLQLSVAEIGLPLRTVNNLQRAGVRTVNDLLHCTPAELLRISNFGTKTLAQVYRCLERLGFVHRSRQPAPRVLRRAG